MPPALHALPGTSRAEVNDRWSPLAAESDPAVTGLAAAPWSMPSFFVAWVAVGVLGSLPLVRRGHDRRTALMTGAGLGPLMWIVAFNHDRARPPVGDRLPVNRG